MRSLTMESAIDLSATTSRSSSRRTTHGLMVLTRRSRSSRSSSVHMSRFHSASTKSRSASTMVFGGSGSYSSSMRRVTVSSDANSTLCTAFSHSARVWRSLVSSMSMELFFWFRETPSSSTSRGTPSVTFLDEIPALWNVLRVICVAGSPHDCAAMGPIISPAGQSDCRYLRRISPSRNSKAFSSSLYSLTTRFDDSEARRWMKKSVSAESMRDAQCTLLTAPPGARWCDAKNCLMSVCSLRTCSTTCTGFRRDCCDGRPTSNAVCALPMRRPRLTGRQICSLAELISMKRREWSRSRMSCSYSSCSVV
mmetsp:Transcript_44022/g.135880  ORF Transcript_44022/g.135880 Transcript_44022/m.135880 type:complete len:309 (+) Transcript_44022:922-1848(+)